MWPGVCNTVSGVSWVATCGKVSLSSRNSVGAYVGTGIATSSQREWAGRVAGARKEPAAEDAATADVGNSDMPPIRSKWQWVNTNTYPLFPASFNGFPSFSATGTVSMNSRSVTVWLSGFRAHPVSIITISVS